MYYAAFLNANANIITIVNLLNISMTINMHETQKSTNIQTCDFALNNTSQKPATPNITITSSESIIYKGYKCS